MKRKITVDMLIAIILVIGSAFVGFCANEVFMKPQTEFHPVYYPEYRYITQEIPKPFEVIVEVEKIVEVSPKLRDFESIEELKSWLEDFGIFYVGSTSTKVPCGDWVNALQKQAIQDGYILNIDVVSKAEYGLRFKKMHLDHDARFHGIVSAVIGDDVYYIEPQTFEIQHYYYFGR